MPGIDPRISVLPLDRIHFGMRPELAKAITDATGTSVEIWSTQPQSALFRVLPDRVAWELADALSKLDAERVILSGRADAAARRRKSPLNAMVGAPERWWEGVQPRGQRVRAHERLKIDRYRVVYRGHPIVGDPKGSRGGLGRGLQRGRIFGKMAILETGQPVAYARTPEKAMAAIRSLEKSEPRVRGLLRVEIRDDLRGEKATQRGVEARKLILDRPDRSS